jgi:hypothetical protein
LALAIGEFAKNQDRIKPWSRPTTLRIWTIEVHYISSMGDFYKTDLLNVLIIIPIALYLGYFLKIQKK